MYLFCLQISSLFVCLFVFQFPIIETVSHYVAQAGLTPSPLASTSWSTRDHRQVLYYDLIEILWFQF